METTVSEDHAPDGSIASEHLVVPTTDRSPSRYLVAVLYYGSVDYEHAKCMRRIKDDPRIVDALELTGCPYIGIGRSIAAQVALERGLDGVLFIDHDIIFEPGEITRVLDSCDETRAVVGAAYSMRSPGSKMIGAVDLSQTQNEKVRFFEGGAVHPALYLGMGFTAIHRDALVAMGKNEPSVRSGVVENLAIKPLFSLMIEDDKWYGEDVSFCIRAKRAGVGVYMDTALRVWHKGSYTFGLEDCSIVVPYMKSLEALYKDDPQLMQSAATPHPEVLRAQTKRDEAIAAGTELENESHFPESASI